MAIDTSMYDKGSYISDVDLGQLNPALIANNAAAATNALYQTRLQGMAFADEQRRRKDQNALLGMMMKPGTFQNAPNNQMQGNAMPVQGQPPAQPANNALTAPAPQGQPQQPQRPQVTNALLTTTEPTQSDTGSTQEQRPPTFMDRYTAPIMNQPRPDMVWQAAREGRISPQGAYEYQQQYVAQIQAAEDKAFNDFQAVYKPWVEMAKETKNDGIFQATIKAGLASGIPRVQKISQTLKDANAHITPEGNTKSEIVLTEKNQPLLLSRAADDLIKESIQGGKIGDRLEVTEKDGKIVESKVAAKEFTEPYTTRIGGKPVLVQRNLKTGEIKRLAEDKSTTVVVKAGGGGGGGGEGGAPSFNAWDAEMKRMAFEDYKATGKMPDFGSKWKNGGADYKRFTKEYYQWRKNGKIETADVMGERADIRALNDLTKREQLIGTFTNRIDATSKVVLDLARKYKNSNSRLLNVPINKLASMVGSGEYQALRLALTSLSNEVAKVESGSLGIAEVSQSQAENMRKIHDADLSINDMVKIIETGKALGKTNMESIGKQRKELKGRIKQSNNESPPEDSKIPKFNSAVNRVKSYMSGHWDNDNYAKSMWKTLKKAGYSDTDAVTIYDAAKGAQ